MPTMALSETSLFLIIIFWMGYCLAVTEGELRCYCNESDCVSTSYMCKSTAGQCFTALEMRGDTTHQTHGCLDSLSEPHRSSCISDVEELTMAASSPTGVRRKLSLLLCCSEHMCNYREDVDISFVLTPAYNNNRSSLSQRGKSSNKKELDNNDIISAPNPDPTFEGDSDLWFKAAVIAVPIAGGFILVLLVLLAVRMLKKDTNYHRRLIQLRHDRRNYTKAHAYFADGHYNGFGKKQQHRYIMPSPECSSSKSTRTPLCFPPPALPASLSAHECSFNHTSGHCPEHCPEHCNLCKDSEAASMLLRKETVCGGSLCSSEKTNVIVNKQKSSSSASSSSASSSSPPSTTSSSPSSSLDQTDNRSTVLSPDCDLDCPSSKCSIHGRTIINTNKAVRSMDMLCHHCSNGNCRAMKPCTMVGEVKNNSHGYAVVAKDYAGPGHRQTSVSLWNKPHPAGSPV